MMLTRVPKKSASSPPAFLASPPGQSPFLSAYGCYFYPRHRRHHCCLRLWKTATRQGRAVYKRVVARKCRSASNQVSQWPSLVRIVPCKKQSLQKKAGGLHNGRKVVAQSMSSTTPPILQKNECMYSLRKPMMHACGINGLFLCFQLCKNSGLVQT